MARRVFRNALLVRFILAVFLLQCLACDRAVGGQRTAAASPLNEAYVLMVQAKPVYQGHRVKAIQHVAAAARLKGERLGRGNYKRPGDSNAKMRAAQSSLLRVRDMYSGPAGERINRAIEEISTALSVHPDEAASAIGR